MIQYRFSIYDQKAKAYMKPFFEPTVGLAERVFTQACMQTDSPLHMYPADFTLFELGTFCQTTADETKHDAPINRGNALHYITQANEGAKLLPSPDDQPEIRRVGTLS